MAENSGGKWAAEVYDLLRLFRRIGRSVIGLLFLELGWLLYITALSKLAYNTSTGSGTTATASRGLTLEFPWPTGSFAQPFKLVNVQLVALYFSGALLILAAWLFYSGMYRYLSVPLWAILKVVAIIVYVVVVVIAAIINIPMLLFTVPLERWQLNTYLKKNGFTNEVLQGMDIEKRENIRKDALEKISGRWVIRENARGALTSFVSRSISRGKIGIAYLVSDTYDEDLQASKIPRQAFSYGIERLKYKMRNFDLVNFVKYDFLPPQIIISNSKRAEIIRRLFGLDVLLWGSYVAGNKDIIWLNIQVNRTLISAAERKNEKKTEDEKEKEREVDESRIFPHRFDINPQTILMNQNEPLDAYAVIFLSMLIVLQIHRKKREDDRLMRSLDRIAVAWHRKDDIIFRFIEDTFLPIPDNRELRDDFIPSTRSFLVEMVGKWLGNVVNPVTYKSGPLVIGRAHPSFKKLHPVAQKCVKLMPHVSVHYYRLGAIECLLGNKVQAVDAFKQARKLEVGIDKLRYIHDTSAADIIVIFARPNFDTDRQSIALAQFTALSARAINIGGHEACKAVVEMTENPEIADVFSDNPIYMEVLREMMNDVIIDNADAT